jgi:hypothetical protein
MRAAQFDIRAFWGWLVLAVCMSPLVAAAAPPFSAANLTGYWGFQLLPAKSLSAVAPGDPAGVMTAARQNVLRVGVIHFDGATAVDGHMIATTDDQTGTTVIVDFFFTGTYMMNTTGIGTMSIAPVGIDDTRCTPAQAPGVCATLEGPETYAIAMTRNRGLSLAETDNPGAPPSVPPPSPAKIFLAGEAQKQSNGPPQFANRSIRKALALRLVPATSFAVNCLAADPGMIAAAGRQHVLRVGTIIFSGVGTVGGHMVATTDDNSGNTVVVEFDWGGVCAINTDGTGSMTMMPLPTTVQCTPPQLPGVCPTLVTSETYAMAIVPKRGRVYLTETSNAGGAKLFLGGEANYQ